MITLTETSTPEVIVEQGMDVLLETVVAAGFVIATAAETVDIITETVATEIVTTTDPGDTITGTEEVGFVILSAAEQGPQGPPGTGGGGAEYTAEFTATGATETIPARHQKLVYGKYEIEGTLDVEGRLVLV